MKQFVFRLSILFAFITIFSCQPDEPIDDSSVIYENGIFVVNQGKFTGGTGTLTFKSSENDLVYQDAYATENQGEPLGNIAQSMIRHKDRYYIVVNNANKIVVTDLTLNKIGTISGIELPRYFSSTGDKLYVSAYGADFQSGRIYEIDITNLSIKNTISVGNAPEQMLVDNNTLYVAVGSPYGGSSRNILTINTETNLVTQTIDVGDSPSSMVKDQNGDLWILCAGNYAFNPADNTSGSLVKIRNNQVVQSFVLPTGVTSLVVSKSGEDLYYINGNKVVQHNIYASNINDKEILVGGSYFSLAYDNRIDHLYISDAKTFDSDGTVIDLNMATLSQTTFPCGIAPGFIYIVD